MTRYNAVHYEDGRLMGCRRTNKTANVFRLTTDDASKVTCKVCLRWLAIQEENALFKRTVQRVSEYAESIGASDEQKRYAHVGAVAARVIKSQESIINVWKALTSAVVAAIVFFMLAAPAAANEGCRSDPYPPVAPPGCRRMVAQCVCDQNGRNCHINWICER